MSDAVDLILSIIAYAAVLLAMSLLSLMLALPTVWTYLFLRASGYSTLASLGGVIGLCLILSAVLTIIMSKENAD